jgi:hypothetical protein
MRRKSVVLRKNDRVLTKKTRKEIDRNVNEVFV